jgi:SAM-dependent methyltransferase
VNITTVESRRINFRDAFWRDPGRTTLGKTPGRRSIDAFLARHATTALTLEVGAGSSPYARLFPNRIGLDPVAYPHNDVQADAHFLPFRDTTFEVIVCTEVLEHVHTPSQALAEMRRVLKPGGTLVLTTPFAYPIHHAPCDYYRFTRYGLAHLLRDWDVEVLEESTEDTAALVVFFHQWLFSKKTVPWKLPKLLWLAVWAVLQRRHRTAFEAAPGGRPIMPAGYLVVARRPVREATT